MHRCNHRRGVIVIVVIVCLMVAAAIIVLVARQAGMQRRTQRTSHWGVQAEWLAEAGIERAAARLAANAAYVGETWHIAAADLGGDDAAEVRIKTEAIANHPGQRMIRVEADYPIAPELRCRRVKQMLVDREKMASPPAAKASK